MAQKPSLHAALHSSQTKKQPAPAPAAIEAEPESKKLIVELPFEAHLQIDQMKRDLRRGSMRDLVREALNDLFTKYNYPPIA